MRAEGEIRAQVAALEMRGVELYRQIRATQGDWLQAIDQAAVLAGARRALLWALGDSGESPMEAYG